MFFPTTVCHRICILKTYVFIFDSAESLLPHKLSSCSEWRLHFVVAHGLLPAVASLAAELRLSGTWLQSLRRMDSAVGSRALVRRLSSCGSGA